MQGGRLAQTRRISLGRRVPVGLDGNVNYWTGYSTEYWKRVVPTRHYC